MSCKENCDDYYKNADDSRKNENAVVLRPVEIINDSLESGQFLPENKWV